MDKKSALIASLLIAGCYAGIEDEELEQRSEEVAEIIDNLKVAGFPDSEIEVLDDGTVFVGKDAIVTLEASREIAGHDHSNDFRQYRTNNLVDSSVQTICIDPSGAFNGNANLSDGLDLAIQRYNAQGLTFQLVRNGSGCDATITAQVDGSGGGSAGFPSGGQPYNNFFIGSVVGTYGVDVASHVIAHELGHCIGFRHSDYYNRSISCGTGGNEGSAGVGAVLIPGTPSTAVVGGSIMNSCFSLSSTGVFTGTDEIALDYLYGAGGGGDGGGGDGGGGDGGGGDGGGGDGGGGDGGGGDGGDGLLDELWNNDFESGWGNFNDGGSDAFLYDSATFAGAAPVSAVIRDDSNTSRITSDPFDLSGYNTARIEFHLYLYSMEYGEDFFIDYNDGIGSGWVPLASAASGINVFNNTPYPGIYLEFTSSDVNFTDSAQIRFRNDASTNSDYIMIDDVVFLAD